VNISHSDVEVTAQRSPCRHQAEIDLRSPALGRTVTVRLLTPRGWAPGDGGDWPTLYLLHGGDDDASCWTRHTDIAALALAAGLLVVLPPAGRAGFYSDWRGPDRHGTTPAWERFHVVELRQLIESRYGGGSRRAVAGVSMGGYGAMKYAARNPAMFAAAAAYSGMLHTTRRGTPAFLRLYLRSVGERAPALWESRQDWLDNDPFQFAHRLAQTPVYLAAGNGERASGDPPIKGAWLLERLIAPGTADLAGRLRELGSPLRLSVGPGTHSWPSWQRELNRSWTFLTDSLH
jgi:S-formylglutathione hydrolase FrmB